MGPGSRGTHTKERAGTSGRLRRTRTARRVTVPVSLRAVATGLGPVFVLGTGRHRGAHPADPEDDTPALPDPTGWNGTLSGALLFGLPTSARRTRKTGAPAS